MKRIAIIGSPGTGKSTFARLLADKTGLPLIHLDFYYHDKEHGYYRNKDLWIARTFELSQADTWIIDGNFSNTLNKRLQQADSIFYFDMPTHIAVKGIIKRWITAKHTKRLDMPSDWQEKPTWNFFWYVLQFRHKHTISTNQLLKDNKLKNIIIFKNHSQVAEYLKTMQ